MSSVACLPPSSVSVTVHRGLSPSSPAALASIPDTSPFWRIESSLSIIPEIVASSASAEASCEGCAIVQGALASARFTSATSSPALGRRKPRTLARSISKGLLLFSLSSTFSASSLLTQSAPRPTAPAAQRKASAVTRVRVVCFIAMSVAPSAALARLPDQQAGEEQRERQHVEGEQLHGADLRGGEEQMVRRARARPDGDLGLLVCRPGDRVQRQVAVAE